MCMLTECTYNFLLHILLFMNISAVRCLGATKFLGPKIFIIDLLTAKFLGNEISNCEWSEIFSINFVLKYFHGNIPLKLTLAIVTQKFCHGNLSLWFSQGNLSLKFTHGNFQLIFAPGHFVLKLPYGNCVLKFSRDNFVMKSSHWNWSLKFFLGNPAVKCNLHGTSNSLHVYLNNSGYYKDGLWVSSSFSTVIVL